MATFKRGSNSSAYILARLDRDGLTELAARRGFPKALTELVNFTNSAFDLDNLSKSRDS